MTTCLLPINKVYPSSAISGEKPPRYCDDQNAVSGVEPLGRESYHVRPSQHVRGLVGSLRAFFQLPSRRADHFSCGSNAHFCATCNATNTVSISSPMRYSMHAFRGLIPTGEFHPWPLHALYPCRARSDQSRRSSHHISLEPFTVSLCGEDCPVSSRVVHGRFNNAACHTFFGILYSRYLRMASRKRGF